MKFVIIMLWVNPLEGEVISVGDNCSRISYMTYRIPEVIVHAHGMFHCGIQDSHNDTRLGGLDVCIWKFY